MNRAAVTYITNKMRNFEHEERNLISRIDSNTRVEENIMEKHCVDTINNERVWRF